MKSQPPSNSQGATLTMIRKALRILPNVTSNNTVERQADALPATKAALS
jgi:hypothetical protein